MPNSSAMFNTFHTCKFVFYLSQPPHPSPIPLQYPLPQPHSSISPPFFLLHPPSISPLLHTPSTPPPQSCIPYPILHHHFMYKLPTFHKAVGESNPYVWFGYGPYTIFNHKQGQVSGSMNADTINENLQQFHSLIYQN